MVSASFQSQEKRERTPLQRRIGGILFALLVELLLVLALISLNRFQPEPKKAAPPLSFQLIPEPEKGGGERASKAAPAKQSKPVPKSGEVVTTPPPVVPPPEPVTPPKQDLFPDLVRIDKDTLASGDIGKIPSTAREGGDTGKDSVAAYGPGQGPGGQPLYNAEWVREPTQAELAFYLPPIKESGWALIACKTAPDNRVENCRTMGESPLGSGLSRGFRQAAWQFRVYPPRVGGKKLIGAWVRIYYQLTVTQKQR
ncbi:MULTISPECIES: hypothetical protein [Sphingomonas]|uniref:hypothetical protein n=1 Tax=Sphingomonas TaxID=13687 RepID=UPI00082F183C|nr:hypothetical protein [Sphingomonas sp. CCH10-B3]